MSDFPKLQPGILEGAMQSLKKREEIREWSAKIAFTLQSIYNRNAQEAFRVRH